MGWVAAVIGAFQIATGVSGANRQENIDRGLTKLAYESDLEDIRRREFEQQYTQGEAKAYSENAGVLHTGGSTAQGYLTTMAEQFMREINFMKAYAEEARRLGFSAAKAGRRAGVYDALASGASTWAGGMGGKGGGSKGGKKGGGHK